MHSWACDPFVSGGLFCDGQLCCQMTVYAAKVSRVATDNSALTENGKLFDVDLPAVSKFLETQMLMHDLFVFSDLLVYISFWEDAVHRVTAVK